MNEIEKKPTEKEALRDKLKKDVEEFISDGGEIRQLEVHETSLEKRFGGTNVGISKIPSKKKI